MTASEAPAAPPARPVPVVPRWFCRNSGQAPAEVRWFARTPGIQMLALDDGFHVRSVPRPGSRAPAIGLTFHLEGADSLRWRPGTQKGVYHFLVGERARWRRGVPAFDGIEAEEVVDGASVRLTCEAGAPRYDVTVTDLDALERVRIRVEGADRLEVDEAGRLVARVGRAALVQTEPVAWVRTAEGGVRPVEVRFRLLDAATYGFSAEPFEGLLCVDPTILYSTLMGGDAGAEAYDLGFIAIDPAAGEGGPPGIDVDGLGTVLACGDTQSVDYDVTPGAYDTTLGGNMDAVVTAFAGRLGPYVYSTFLGGSAWDLALGLAVDPQTGTAYVVGKTYSTDFPIAAPTGQIPFSVAANLPTIDPTSSTLNRGGFLTIFDPAGGSLVSSNVVAGGWFEDVAVKSTGSGRPDAVVVGTGDQPFASIVAAAQGGAFQPDNAGSVDAVVFVSDVQGTTIKNATLLGGFADDYAMCIAVASDGIVVGGATQSTTSGSQPLFPFSVIWENWTTGSQVGFVAKLTADLKQATYIGPFGGSTFSDTTVFDCAVVDGTSEVVCVGATLEPQFCPTGGGPGPAGCAGFPTTVGAYQVTKITPPSPVSGFAARIPSNGSALAWCTYLHQTPDTDGLDCYSSYGCAVNAQGDAIAVGACDSPNYPVTTTPAFDAPRDGLFSVLKADGSSLIGAKYLGSGDGGTEEVYSVVRSHADNVFYVLGATTSLGFFTSAGAARPSTQGPPDFFVLALRAIP